MAGGRVGRSSPSADKIALQVLRRVRNRLRATVNNRQLYLYDLAAAGGALMLALAIRLGLDMPGAAGDQSLWSYVPVVMWFVVICGLIFPFTCLYSRDWRYASVGDLLGIVGAACTASLLFVFWMFVLTRLEAFPRSVIAIEVLALVPLLGMVRVRSKLTEMRQLHPAAMARMPKPDVVPVLLVGAGSVADLYLRALQRDPYAKYWPVGILDVAPHTQGFVLRGVPVLGHISEFDTIFQELDSRGLRPRHLIFTDAAGGLRDREVQAILDRAERLGLAISRPAPAHELRHPSSAQQLELRPIELTDLLERPQIALDLGALSRMIRDRRILVTGAGGSIGSELVRQVAKFEPAEIVLIDNCEYNLYAIDLEMSETFPVLKRTAHLCDVRQSSRLNPLFEEHKPHIVFNAAALKHVPMVELNPCEGILTNVVGTANVAEATRRCGALAMVQISTDKVVNSTNVMGATKRLAELYCQSLDLEPQGNHPRVRFMTVRFGNVLGSSGSLIPLFKRQIARGGPVTVTDPEMKRFFMTIREAVELTLQASAYGLEQGLGHGQIFVLDMGQPIRIVDLARRMIQLAGYSPDKDIKIEFVGCRPGEKLFEELFDEREQRVDVAVPGVLGAVPSVVPLKTLRQSFATLARRAEVGDAEGALGEIAKLVPGYKPFRMPRELPLPKTATARAEDKIAV